MVVRILAHPDAETLARGARGSADAGELARLVDQLEAAGQVETIRTDPRQARELLARAADELGDGEAGTSCPPTAEGAELLEDLGQGDGPASLSDAEEIAELVEEIEVLETLADQGDAPVRDPGPHAPPKPDRWVERG